MSSLDFNTELQEFRDFYNDSALFLEQAKSSLISLISALMGDSSDISISKIEGRVKTRDECISKFIRKYRSELEGTGTSYSMKDHITDLIGIRIVCLYESDIYLALSALQNEFEIIDSTDKSAEISGTDATFGYKGMHVDLKLKGQRARLPEYARFKHLPFEVQIRTLVQDAWSVIDHKIKYKKSIPHPLKRRINTLAALFELADREFLQIRNETSKEIEAAEASYRDIEAEATSGDLPGEASPAARFTPVKLDAFSFQKISKHFFPDFNFEDKRVDGFVEEVMQYRPNTTRGKFNYYIKSAISLVKQYAAFQADSAGRSMNPFTIMRHCLYYCDSEIFRDALAEYPRRAFETWLTENGHRTASLSAKY